MLSLTTRLSTSVSRTVLLQSRNFSNAKNESPLKGMLKDAATFDDKETDWATQPYPHIPAFAPIEKVDTSSETSIILFPGQGTQFIGMGKSLIKYPNVKELYECASEIAGCDLLNISNEKELSKHAQLSVVTASLAAVERLRDERPSVLPSCVATAGFSLGEITALIFAEALSLEEGLKLVNIRALAMEASSRDKPGGMITVMVSPSGNIKNICSEAIQHATVQKEKNPVCIVANYLYPGCYVVSGTKEALSFIENQGKNHGVRRTKRVNVSGAFHSENMQGAIEPMKIALSYCTVSDPRVPVYSAVNSRPYKTPSHIIRQLPYQIVQPVRWLQLMQYMYARPRGSNFPKTFEVGPGSTLRAILRVVNAPAWDNSFSIAS